MKNGQEGQYLRSPDSIERSPSPFPLPSREGDLKPSPLAGEGRERGQIV